MRLTGATEAAGADNAVAPSSPRADPSGAYEQADQLRRQSDGSAVTEFVEPVVVDAEVVRELVDDGDAHLLHDLLGVEHRSSSGCR